MTINNKQAPALNISNVMYLLFVATLAAFLFIIPLKLGNPYIDEIGFSIPSAAELLFGSWPALYVSLIALVLVAIAITESLMSSNLTLRLSLVGTLIIVFLCICLLSAARSINPNTSTMHLILFFAASAGYYVSRKCTIHPLSENITRVVFVSFLVGLSYVSVIGIHQYFYGLDAMREYIDMDQLRTHALLYRDSQPEQYALYLRIISNRIFSTFVYPNSLAGYLCLTIPLLFGFRKVRFKEILKWYVIIACISSIILSLWFYLQMELSFIPKAIAGALLFPLSAVWCLMLSGSKGGLVALVFSILAGFVIFLSPRIKKITNHPVAVNSILLISLLVFLFIAGRAVYEKSASLQARFGYWDAAAQMIAERPILGYGPGTFGTVYPKYKAPTAEETQFAHNNTLQMITEIGMPGGLVFITLWVMALYFFFNNWSRRSFSSLQVGAAFGLLAFTVHGFIDFDFYIPALAFYAFFMLGQIDVSPSLIANRVPFPSFVGKCVVFTATLVITFMIYLWISNLLIAEAYYNTAFFLFHTKQQSTEAVNLLDEAILLNNKNAQYELLKAEIYLADNQLQQAKLYFSRAIEKNPYRASYHYEFAHVLLKTADKAKAKLEFQKAITYNPSRYGNIEYQQQEKP